MKCENFEKCPFYNDKMPLDSAIAKVYKAKYCEGEKTKCARYEVSTKIGKEYVPIDLYPNMFERAKSILKEHSR